MVQRIVCRLWSFIICCGLAIFGISVFSWRMRLPPRAGRYASSSILYLPFSVSSCRGCTHYPVMCIPWVYMSPRYRYLASAVFDSAVQACPRFHPVHTNRAISARAFSHCAWPCWHLHSREKFTEHTRRNTLGNHEWPTKSGSTGIRCASIS